MIDFFGSGYDVSERMGLLSDLERIHYPIPRLRFVDPKGREKFSIAYPVFRKLFHGRHFNFMRGDLERHLYARVKDDVELRFATTITSFRQETERVQVAFSDGTSGLFDVLVGADGVHSHIRRLAFGEEACFAHFLGYYTAACILPKAPRALGDAFYTLTVPGRQVAVYPIRGGKLATFFAYKAQRPVSDCSRETAVRALRTVYGDMGWIVPELLAQDAPPRLYFDEVAQIAMPRWSVGRVVLVGDACQGVSLLAGQGASLAMAGAYRLAAELARAGSDIAGALTRYERQVKPRIENKQEVGRRMARWCIPDNQARLAVRNMVLRLAAWPMTAQVLKRLLAPESIMQS
jgi:2-polyprenyl-6-methoxyphenol hydroxylase-like FAD-dependent oxidoreductase